MFRITKSKSEIITFLQSEQNDKGVPLWPSLTPGCQGVKDMPERGTRNLNIVRKVVNVVTLMSLTDDRHAHGSVILGVYVLFVLLQLYGVVGLEVV